MKQKLHPGAVAAAIVGALLVMASIAYFANNRTASGTGAAPPALSQSQQPVRNLSPDATVKEHMKQLPPAGGGGQ